MLFGSAVGSFASQPIVNMPIQAAGSATASPPPPTPMAQPTGPNVFQQSSGYMQKAGQTYGNLADFETPMMKAARLGPAREMTAVGQVGDVTAGQLAGTEYGQYMSPYTSQVIERGQADIERQRQLASENLAAQAQRARAFGGSRQGVQEGVLAGEYGRMGMDFAAQQRQQAFQQAQQAAQYDIGQRMQADTLNQRAAEMAAAREQAARSGNMQAANQFAIQQAQFQQQANMANQQAALSGAGIQRGGAAGLASLGSTMFGQGMSGLQQQQAAAARAQQQQQAMLDAARRQTLANLGYPGQALQTGTGILGQLPSARMSTSGTPGLFGILSGLGSLPGFG